MAEELEAQAERAVTPSVNPSSVFPSVTSNEPHEMNSSDSNDWFDKQPGSNGSEPPSIPSHFEDNQSELLPSLMCMPGLNQSSDDAFPASDEV